MLILFVLTILVSFCIGYLLATLHCCGYSLISALKGEKDLE